MNKYQKALDAIKMIDVYSETDKYCKLLQKLIDRCTKPKPIILDVDGFHCPSCGLRLETKAFDSIYCHYCGQRLGAENIENNESEDTKK